MKKIVLNQTNSNRENSLVWKILNRDDLTIEERLNTLVSYNLIYQVIVKKVWS